MQIRNTFKAAALALALAITPTVWADDDHDVEGRIESIDAQSRSFVVKGMTLYADNRTDYDDELNRFSDLKVDQKVEVDYVMRNGKRVAKEIELDD